MHAAKRRRLDASSSTLSKPFRSPMRVDVKKNDNTDQPQNGPTLLKTAISIDQMPPSSPSKLSSSPGRTLPPPAMRPRTTLSSPTHPGPLLNQPRDSEYIALQRQHSALLLLLSQLRTSLDTAQQAVKISKSSTDAELEPLISKWKLASREAAEELFRGARDRVDKMGGMAAWREQTQRRSQGGWGHDQGDERNEDGSELTAEQKVAREVMHEEMDAEMKKYGEGEKEDLVEEDDQSFTMDMMLKQLNVPLDVIGFNKESQKWD